MSIRLRLILALGILLISTIGAMIMALLLDAQHRVRNEVTSGRHVTETLLRSSLDSLEGAPDVEARVKALVANLANLRHVSVRLASEPNPPAERHENGQLASRLLASTKIPDFELPVTVGGRAVDRIIVRAEADDEMSEVWETIGRVSFYSLAFAASAFLLTSYLINRALAPIHDLGRALRLLREGHYNIEVPTAGPPEIARISERVNALAAALKQSRDENRELSAAMVRIQDDEREDVARELHDELGPYLFSIRASGAALQRALNSAAPDLSKAKDLALGFQDQIDALQITNRRVLQQLSPIGLHELGLKGAIEAVVAMWRDQQAACRLQLHIAGDLDDIGRTVSLTVYRTVQEGLTNAFRHADARLIDIDVRREASQADTPDAIRVQVRDDGVGLPDEMEAGYGLKGMRERIGALGGAFSISIPEGGGTQLDAIVPAAPQREAVAD